MTDWREIHEGFGEEYYQGKTWQQEWEKQGLTYQEAQEWIPVGFKPKDFWEVKNWKNQNFTPQETKSWIDIGLTKYDAEFASYLRFKNIRPNPNLNWKQLKEEFNFWTQNPPAQEYLDCFPQNKRNAIKELNLSQKNFSGNFDLSGFVNLEELECSSNNLTSLNLSNCAKLKEIYCQYNHLTEINLPKGEKLEELYLWNNNFNQDLSFLKDLRNLKDLYLGNNKFYGSLEYLKDLRVLKCLDITDTDIDSGLEYLPESVEYFGCSDNVNSIYSLFVNKKRIVETDNNGWIKNFPQKFKDYKQWRKLNFSEEEIKQWITNGAILDNHGFVAWLRDIKNYGLEWIINYKEDYQILSKRFKKYGTCSECNNPNIGYFLNSKEILCPCNPNKMAINDFIKKYQAKASKNTLEWIPHEQFKVIEYLAQGGFGKVYKAKWNNQEVALKSLNNSSDIREDFLQEITNHKLTDGGSNSQVVKCHGISQDPSTKECIMVMQYIKGGSLRKYLDKNYSKLSFIDKLSQLQNISEGLSSIHERELVHRDFHSGNILNYSRIRSYITDLGLSKPIDSEDNGIYGVLPYIAPEVLRNKGYSLKSDIYSFGIIAYEILSGLPPYHDMAHDEFLGIKICQGLRPNLDSTKAPQLLKNLIQKCWDAESSKRPTIDKIKKNLTDWKRDIQYQKNTKFYQQFKGLGKALSTPSNNPKTFDYQIHPSAFYTSRLLDFRNLPKPQNSKEINEKFYRLKESGDLDSLRIGLAKLDIKINSSDLASYSNVVMLMESEEFVPIAVPQNISPNNWQNIHSSFTSELIQTYQNLNFTYSQTLDWANAFGSNFNPYEYEFINWLAHIKNYSAEEVLNNHNLEILKAEFQSYQQNQNQQTLIVQNNN